MTNSCEPVRLFCLDHFGLCNFKRVGREQHMLRALKGLMGLGLIYFSAGKMGKCGPREVPNTKELRNTYKYLNSGTSFLAVVLDLHHGLFRNAALHIIHLPTLHYRPPPPHFIILPLSAQTGQVNGSISGADPSTLILLNT